MPSKIKPILLALALLLLLIGGVTTYSLIGDDTNDGDKTSNAGGPGGEDGDNGAGTVGSEEENELPPADLPESSVDLAAYQVTGVNALDLSGGYKPYLSFGCNGLAVQVSGPDKLQPGDAVLSVDGNRLEILSVDGDSKNQTVLTPCPANIADVAEHKAVLEAQDKESKPFAFPLATAPLVATVQEVTGSAGDTVTVKLNGKFSPDLAYAVKAIALPTNKANEAPEAAVDEQIFDAKFDSKKRTITFKAPETVEGVYFWVSLTASGPGYITSGLTPEPFTLTALSE